MAIRAQCGAYFSSSRLTPAGFLRYEGNIPFFTLRNQGEEMLTIRNLAALAVAVVLSAGAGSAQAAKGKKKGEHHLHGVVVAVDQDKDGSGTITIKTHHKKSGKTGPVAEAEEHTLTYNELTKFEF